MEEAYMELYQEFLRLRSLCLKQAAMLQQLTKALQKQQGTFAPNRVCNNVVSIPDQCMQERPVHLPEEPGPLIATAQSLTAQKGNDWLYRGAGTFSKLLAEDMGKLCLGVPHQTKESGKVEHKTSPFLGLDSPPCVSNHPPQADHSMEDRTLQTFRMPLAGSPFPGSPFLSHSGGMLMSDLALQSQVCEFCQAVFPGDTTTRGEFLRHLCTHIA